MQDCISCLVLSSVLLSRNVFLELSILLGQAILCIKVSVSTLEWRGAESAFNTTEPQGEFSVDHIEYWAIHSSSVLFISFYKKVNTMECCVVVFCLFVLFAQEKTVVELVCCTFFFSHCDWLIFCYLWLSNLFKILKRHLDFMRESMFFICFMWKMVKKI